jgi:uncharacterized Zn finger protein
MRLQRYLRRHQSAGSCLYVCEQCGTKERVPTDVLAFFDAVDPGEPDRPATFQCQQCPGIMYPDEYLRAKRATP